MMGALRDLRANWKILIGLAVGVAALVALVEYAEARDKRACLAAGSRYTCAAGVSGANAVVICWCAR